MSMLIKAVGTLTYDSMDDLADADEVLENQDDDDDEALAEARTVLEEGTERGKKTLTVKFSLSVSADANLIIQDFLEEAAIAASSGHLDLWQDGSDDGFERLHAGGEEESMTGPFPAID
jgi:hypothetical protein